MICHNILKHAKDATPKQLGKYYSSFKFSQIKINKAHQRKNIVKENLGFGQYFTDHMLIIDWNNQKGWSLPQITQYEPLSLSPAIKALHYATSAFEGLKVIKGIDGTDNLFRADRHMERFKTSVERICLPTFDANELLSCIKELIRIDKEWIPKGKNEALYIRPFIFGSDPSLGVDISSEAKLCTILSPVGAYFKAGQTGVSLYADGRFVRAFEGGCGAFKLSANYGPTLYVQQLVRQKGCHSSLWLYGREEYITEAGTMNIFIYWTNEHGENELATPPLSGLILPGITRDSILEITRQWNEFKVAERDITMVQLLKALKENRLHAMFGTGTACVVSPVAELVYKDTRYKVPCPDDPQSITGRIHKALTDIQLGVKGPHPWLIPID